MDERLRPVIAGGLGLLFLFVGFSYVFSAPVPVPGTVYLLVPVMAMLSIYLSYEEMARYVSAALPTEDPRERFSRRNEPIPPPFRDNGRWWLTVSATGYQFFKYVLNQPNVKDGVGTIFVGPPSLFESENKRIIVIRGYPLRLSPLAIRVLMRRRRWRERFLSYDGFDPDVTKVYMVLWSGTLHPDSAHPKEPVGNVAAFGAELGRKLIQSNSATGVVSKSLMDQIHLLSELAGKPEESRAARREPEEASGR